MCYWTRINKLMNRRQNSQPMACQWLDSGHVFKCPVSLKNDHSYKSKWQDMQKSHKYQNHKEILEVNIQPNNRVIFNNNWANSGHLKNLLTEVTLVVVHPINWRKWTSLRLYQLWLQNHHLEKQLVNSCHLFYQRNNNLYMKKP